MPAATCPSCEGITDTSSRSCESCGGPLPVQPGWVIADRYEILAPLGEGGMGAVFRARDRALRVTVAFKVLRLKADRDAKDDQGAVRRFHHEVALARKVRHENVCAVYEYGEDKGVLYCTMELVEGKNLRQILREQAPLPTDRAYRIALKAAAGLQAIHAAGVLHRDLKASNIMIDAKERVRLVDFGIAKAIPTADQEESTGTPITSRDVVVGTPAYMSPEQVMGWPLDARSDIYSFGVVLFELFTGEVPFHGGSRAATMRKHLEEPPPLHGSHAQSLPTPLVRVLERALAKDPDGRYADVAELIRDLERARDSKTDTLESVPGSLPLRWLLPALVLVTGAAVWEIWRPAPPPPEPPASSTIPPSTPSEIVLPSPAPPPTTTPKRVHPVVSPHPGPTGTPAPPTTTVPPTTIAAAPTPTLPATATAAPTTTTTTTTTLPAKPVETLAHCLYCPPPPYPPAAATIGLQGTVELELTIDEKGKVIRTRVLSGPGAFRPAAEKAARSWRFEPATRDGVPIPSTVRHGVEFRQDASR